MSLPSVAIRNPVFAWMLMASLIIFGAIGFNRMGISQLPDVDFPVISVSATLEGAAPEVMETTVVDVLEGQLTSIEGVKSMTSNAKTGRASISLEFDIERDIDLALQDVQARVAQAQRRLPKDMESPTVSKTNPEDQPILWIGVTSKSRTRRDLNLYVRDRLRDQFTILPGVGDVFMGGYVEPSMRIWIDPKKLSSYSLTVSDVLNTITAEHSEPPAGFVDEGTQELNLRTMGEAKDAKGFEELRINTRGGAPNYIPVRMGNLVRVEEGLADIRSISRVNGLTSIGLGIRKQRGSNAVEVAENAIRKMNALKANLPEDIEMRVVFDSTTFIKEAVHELNFALFLAALLTSILCWVFLGSWASTANVLMSIPTSIVGTFIILYFSGFTLNTFTLLGLSLAIGIVVDDAIMVLENIVRHREMGKDARQAALDGSQEIMFAALAATISIAAIFLPVAFMKGVIGKFFFQFGVTMTAAVMLSLLEAVTLTPMRASVMKGSLERTTRFGRGVEHSLEWSKRKYAEILAVCLNHRWKVVTASVVFFLGSLVVAKYLNKEFVPPEDQSRFMVRMQTAVGSSLPFTNSKIAEAETHLKRLPEIANYFVSIGGFGGGDVNTGVFFVSLKPKSERKRNQFEIMADVRTKLAEVKGLRAFVQDLGMGGFGGGRGYPIEFVIQGPDWDALSSSAQKIVKELGESGYATDVDTDYKEGMPEVQILPDRAKAAARGVSVQQIGDTINTLLGGRLAGYYSTGGRRYEIRVKIEENGLTPAQKIGGISVRNNRGELVPLSAVVEIKQEKTLQQINRRDRMRAVSIYGNVKTGQSQSKALEVAQQIAMKNVPEGYRFVPTGSSQTFQESFQSLIFALVLGLIVAYMVLGSQFNSFIDPITVLVALPFSISGAFLALWATGKSLNLYSMIGLILLMGIVKKNSILLVDFTNQVRDRGETDVHRALLEACPTRLRPILMTSFCTIVASIPGAISFGPGAESRAPMSWAVIGGVLLSTFLTLLVVPCFYSLMAKKRRSLQPGTEHPEPRPIRATHGSA